MPKITKADILMICAKEIKEICMSHKKDCLTCPLSNCKQYEDENNDAYLDIKCPFNSKNPSKWNL